MTISPLSIRLVLLGLAIFSALMIYSRITSFTAQASQSVSDYTTPSQLAPAQP